MNRKEGRKVGREEVWNEWWKDGQTDMRKADKEK